VKKRNIVNIAGPFEPAAHFEHTVAITEDGVSVLTAGRNGFGWAQ
jgi:methionine aminopeptidase